MTGRLAGLLLSSMLAAGCPGRDAPGERPAPPPAPRPRPPAMVAPDQPVSGQAPIAPRAAAPSAGSVADADARAETAGGGAATGAGTGAAAAAIPAATIRFTDVTAECGVTFVHHSGKSGQKFYVEPHSGGAALLDHDGDGHLDLYLVDGGPLPGCAEQRREGNKLFRGRGDGTFSEVTSQAGVAGTAYGMGAYAADYDGDGDTDILVTQFDAANVLYRNEGNGRFTDVAAAAGVAAGGWSTGATWLDADRDGDLDLYLVRYLDFTPAKNRQCYYKGHRYHCSPYDYPGVTDLFFRNLGNGKFREETKQVGMVDPTAKGLGAIAADMDQDGWPDVYVANDETPNLLYRNLHDGRFAEVGLLAGVAVNPAGATQAGMGLDVGDVDGDNLQDVACCNFQSEPNNLYMNKGQGRFVDEAGPRGWDAVSRDLLCFTVLFEDFDLDGDLDAFITCGHVWDNVAEIQPGVSYPQRNLLLVNDGRGYFSDLGAAAGEAFVRREVSRAGVVGDIDEDGDADLAYLNIDGPAVVLRNDTPRAGNHWLNVRLRGRGKNREGIGALVIVESGGRRWQREMRTVRGFFSSSPAEIRFGLGPATQVERITVRWQDGGADTVVDGAGLAVDRTLVVER